MSGRGKLVVVEGADGVGRTSVVRRLQSALGADGLDVTTVRLRGSAGLRGALRSLQRRADIAERALFLLYAADLADVSRTAIEPALAAGGLVLADRYTLTPVVRAAARGLDPVWARDVLSFLPEPDLTLVLQADARLRLGRMLGRRRFLTPRESGLGATFRSDPQAMLIRYQHRLDALFETGVDDPAVRGLDATRDLAAVAAEALGLVRRALRRREGGETP